MFKILTLLVATDWLTKAVFPTPAWAFHDRSLQWQLSGLIGIAIPAGIAYLFPNAAAGCALLAAGVAANVGNSLLGPVSNPFRIVFDGQGFAFNLADLYLVFGAILIAVAMLPLLWQERPA